MAENLEKTILKKGKVEKKTRKRKEREKKTNNHRFLKGEKENFGFCPIVTQPLHLIRTTIFLLFVFKVFKTIL